MAVSLPEWFRHNSMVLLWRANGSLHAALEFSLVELFPLKGHLPVLPGLPQTSTLWESDGVITGFTCWFPFPQRSLSPLLSAFWGFKLLPHIFCLGISVCFVTVAKRVNPISVKYVLANQTRSPQTPSLKQKKVWLGQEVFPRREVGHDKLCHTHLSGLRFGRVVPDTT